MTTEVPSLDGGVMHAGGGAPAAPDTASDLRSNTLAELTASVFLDRLGRGKASVEQYVHDCAERVDRFESDLHVWHAFDRDQVIARARQIDGQLSRGQEIRQLTGVPIGVKDIFNTYDYATGMGSRIMDGYTPGNDARVVSNARIEGGIVMGKTVTAEFAVHHPGPTVHPLDHSRSPGTSSSGSAVAVATRMVPVALCSQTAGSIIRPASYCGIFGFKPSFGLVPRTGVLKTTDTLDTIGFMARSVEDLRLMFEVCRVRGQNYPVSEAGLARAAAQKPSGRPWRVGVVEGPKTEFETSVAKAGLDAVAGKLSDAGCDVFRYRLPREFDEAHDIHERIYRRALAYYFELEWNANADLFSESIQAMINGGREVSPEQYAEDIATQRALARVIDAEADKFDVLLGLSTAGEAPHGLGADDLPDHCLIWTMCGMPTLSLPLLTGRDGLPVGVSVTAHRYSDYTTLDFASYLECLMAT